MYGIRFFGTKGTVILVRIPSQEWYAAYADGRKYEIDRVTDIRQAAAMKAGGQGDRYTVMISGHQSYLFFERNHSLTGNNLGRWFVERRTA